MADDGGVTILVRQFDGVQGFRQTADLVDFDQDGVGHAFVDAFAQELHVGDEKIVAHQLDFVAELVGEQLPGLPIVLGATIFNADDGVFGGQFRVDRDQFLAGDLAAAALLEDVVAGLGVVEFRGSDVQSQEDLLARFVAGVLDGLEDDFDRGIGALQLGSEPAFVADGRREAFTFQHGFEGVEGFGDGAQPFGISVKALRHDHEFLEIDGGVRVRAAVDDVRHGHRQNFGVGPAQVFEQRQIEFVGGGLGVGQRNGQDGVRAEFGFGFRAVQFQHRAVDQGLFGGIQTFQSGQDDVHDVFHGLAHPFAAVTFLVAVAQFDGLILTSAGAGGDRGAASHSTLQNHVDFHGGVAAGVENLTGDNILNQAHIFP